MDLLPVALVGVLLGTVLGLLGGGGGILAIPLLVHVLGQSVDEASTTSLIVVAAGAAAGLIPHAIAGRVDWRAGFTFGVLGVLGAVVGARAALLTDDRIQVAGLIALIFLAASGMLRGAGEESTTRMRHRIPVDAQGRPIAAAPPADPPGGPGGPGDVPQMAAAAAEPADAAAPQTRGPGAGWARLLGSATVVALVTGFFGVGGGFVAVPALIYGAGLTVRKATATGLLVIVINSAVAFAARGPELVEWHTTVWLAAFAAVAAVAAALLSKRLPSMVLKRLFGWMLLLVGFYEVWHLASQVAAS